MIKTTEIGLLYPYQWTTTISHDQANEGDDQRKRFFLGVSRIFYARDQEITGMMYWGYAHQNL
jgi:hypothetical protein